MADDIQKIKIDIALSQALIFIGAGVSTSRTNGKQQGPYWRGLLKSGLQRYYQLGWITASDYDDFNKKFESNKAEVDDYLFAADQIKRCFEIESNATQTDVLKTWLKETVESLSVKNPEIIKAIGELECPILTTNYDSLLENILNKTSLTWTSFHSNGIAVSWKNLKKYIVHVHGYFEDSDSIIFSSKDYDRMREDKFGQSKLRAIMETKTLLFIGYDFGMSDPNFSNLVKWIFHLTGQKQIAMYNIVKSSYDNGNSKQRSDIFLLKNVKEIQYGKNSKDLFEFIRNLKSFTLLIRENALFTNRRVNVRKKYLNYLIDEYGHVSIFGYSNNNNNVCLPLESVYIELKFDPTHPSIRAMKTLEIHEEFKRKISSHDFFTENEIQKLKRAIIQRQTWNFETIHRDLMTDQWLKVLLNDKTIFTSNEVTTIKRKLNQLKRNILEKNNLNETKQYQVQQAYNEFKHFIILGHPGSGKTTLSKWLVINMAKQCLGKENMLFDGICSREEKIPILIPIWKYVDQLKINPSKPKKTLLEFIYQNPIVNSTFFTFEEQKELSSLIIESLLQGNVLIVFEGLDEIPTHIDRTDLMKEINALLERAIDYDVQNGKLIYSIYEQKEINNIRDCTVGNRFIVTSRIEGNYFDEINFYIPRLTIENLSNDSLKIFFTSYMKCISNRTETYHRIDQLYDNITQNKDIFQLAINPQLASVIAAIYHQSKDKLPKKRIDLYEKAIETMIERIVNFSNNSTTNLVSQEFKLNTTMLWSIMQDIAEYLHSKVEGLSENILKQIIRKYLINNQTQTTKIDLTINFDDSISKLVNIFKYHAGLLTEFSYDSFRFIHRTFQEYLAAKSIIYSNGIQRAEDTIYENIKNKIDNPNWRVPLSMTFGILSQSNELFNRIVRNLLNNEMRSSNAKFSTFLTPFIIIDSLNDLYFSSKRTEHELVLTLADMLLSDYQNMFGFSRLNEHQELIHSYFLKLKRNYDNILAEWFIEKIDHEENLASCANIIWQLKWYKPVFYEIFLKNLHNDSAIWNWPIDSLLRFYSNDIEDVANLKTLQFKNEINKNPQLIKHITEDNDWLRLIAALYGGYKNYNTPADISEYYEIVQFLNLSDTQRMPFTFYYQEIWDRHDPAYNMALYLDNSKLMQYCTRVPMFDKNEIYKDSILTKKILELIVQGKSAMSLIEELRQQATLQRLNINEKLEVFIALTVLGDFEFINTILKTEEETFVNKFANSIEQLIYTLKDPIARCSSYIGKYLLAIYDNLKMNQSMYNINFADYCKIYFTLIVNSGGLSVETNKLAEAIDDDEIKASLNAEYLAYTFTGSNDDIRYNVAALLDHMIENEPDKIRQALLKVNDAVQIYRPVRSYAWPMDIFTFKSNKDDNLSITLFNCLRNIHRELGFAMGQLADILFTKEYLVKNPQLIPLVVLLNFGYMSKDTNSYEIYSHLFPDMNHNTNIKEFLFEKIQSISNPYYKSRALYQLAEFYDEKSYELLYESFTLTKNIQETSLKFQILEKIYDIIHYKDSEQASFIQEIVDELILSFDTILEHNYNRAIASIRLSFYGSRDFRKRYLINAVETISKMNDDDDKYKLIIKIKPLVIIYDDLQIRLNEIINSLTNNTYKYFVNSCYGRLLLSNKLNDNISHSKVLASETLENDNDVYNRNEIYALFSLFAQLNDMKLSIGKTESLNQLWTNLYKDADNPSNIEKILKLALENELFLTPQVAIIIDELVRQGKEDNISILFPYIIKPSDEVLPIVHRWFIDYHNNPIKKLAALLLTEARHIFEAVIDTLIDLLNDDNDQIRYRAQRIFQHPERDVKEPSKRISVIGERALIKILRNIPNRMYHLRVRSYLGTFFYDLLWDDPIVVKKLYESITASEETTNCINGRRILFFNRMKFINANVWNRIMESLEFPHHLSYVEGLLHSAMALVRRNQITEDDWGAFARVLSLTDTSQFTEKLYFIHTDVEIIQFIVNEIRTLTQVNDDVYFEILESRLMSEMTIRVENLSQSTYEEIKHIERCSFCASVDLNQEILNILHHTSINIVMMKNLIKWLIQKMSSIIIYDDTIFSWMICDCLLIVTSACVQKEDYLYRKITNSQDFDKTQMIKLLEKMLNNHPYFPGRGSAFILLSAMDQSNYKVIVNAMNTLLDENLVKEYAVIGTNLIHLSRNDFVDDLLNSLKNESAIKIYEILKIFTQLALSEKLNANGKSKIINYLAKETGKLEAKKLVNYYYTDIKIPFTTTLEKELYKSWTRIQGLSGKAQYSVIADKPK